MLIRTRKTDSKGRVKYFNVLTGKYDVLPYRPTYKIKRRIPDYAMSYLGK